MPICAKQMLKEELDQNHRRNRRPSLGELRLGLFSASGQEAQVRVLAPRADARLMRQKIDLLEERKGQLKVLSATLLPALWARKSVL